MYSSMTIVIMLFNNEIWFGLKIWLPRSWFKVYKIALDPEHGIILRFVSLDEIPKVNEVLRLIKLQDTDSFDALFCKENISAGWMKIWPSAHLLCLDHNFFERKKFGSWDEQYLGLRYHGWTLKRPYYYLINR